MTPYYSDDSVRSEGCKGTTRRGSQCGNNPTVQREDHWYCYLHDPVIIKARSVACAAYAEKRKEEQRMAQAVGNALLGRLGVGGWVSFDGTTVGVNVHDLRRLADEFDLRSLKAQTERPEA